MKKILVLIAMLGLGLVFVSSSQAATVTFFSDAFADLTTNSWVTSGTVSVISTAPTSDGVANNKYVFLDNSGSRIFKSGISTSGYENIYLNYYRKTNNFEGGGTGDNFKVEWSSDGSTWTSVETILTNIGWAQKGNTSLGGGADDLSSGIAIRFTVTSGGGNTNDDAYIDLVQITGDEIKASPEPMSLSLLGMGLLGALGAGFRRKK
jgi:hypothetical protein